MKKDIHDHIGEHYGSLTVVGIQYDYRRKENVAVCKCECGRTTLARFDKLKDGRKKSCGCQNGIFHTDADYIDERARQYIQFCIWEHNSSKKKNDESEYHRLINQNKKLYWIWQGMLKRCTRPTYYKYQNYGGRGITVCAEWQTFRGFHKWAVNNGYADNLSIDRIDTNGNYEPSNCRWTDQKTQQNNKRNNFFVNIDGEIHSASQWATYLGVTSGTIRERTKRGWYQRATYEDYINYSKTLDRRPIN